MCSTTGIEDNPSTQNLCKDSLPKNKDKNTKVISRLCTQRITKIVLKLNVNILIDLWSSNLSLTHILQGIKDQSTTHLKTEVFKEIQISDECQEVFPNLVIVFSIRHFQ